MLMAIATLGMPEQWNTTCITPVHKKGLREDAANCYPASVMEPLPKLFAACLNWALEQEAQTKGWRAPTQAGFHLHHQLEDLIVPVEYVILQAQCLKAHLAL